LCKTLGIAGFLDFVHKELLDVGERIILKWILERWDAVLWTGLSYLRMGISGKLL
jgi:hypothetical protein